MGDRGLGCVAPAVLGLLGVSEPDRLRGPRSRLALLILLAYRQTRTQTRLTAVSAEELVEQQGLRQQNRYTGLDDDNNDHEKKRRWGVGMMKTIKETCGRDKTAISLIACLPVIVLTVLIAKE